jgi:ribosomal protein L29
MKVFIKVVFTLIFSTCLTSLSAQTVQEFQKQLDDMSRQLAQLKTELAALRYREVT